MSCDHEDLNDDEDDLTFLHGIQSGGRMVRVVRPQGRTLYCTGCDIITLRDL